MTNFGFETLGGGGTGGGLTYLGTWNATTNTPLITSGVGSAGDYYIVDVAGTTNIDGISDWQIGDWIIFSSTGVWQKIDNSDLEGYNLIQDEGVPLTKRSIIDFQGAGVIVSDDALNSKTIVTIPSSGASTNVKTTTFGCAINGGGFAPLVGIIGYTSIPYSGTITEWTIIGDVSGSCVIDVWKAAGVVPTVANTIAGTEKPTLTAQQLNTDNALTTWTTAVTAGDIIGFYLDSASTLTSINLIITIVKS